MSGTIKIFNDNGTISDYETLASRLPRFLQKYGPETGFRIIIESKSFLDAHPGLLKLYEAAMSSGKKPEDVGLPPIGRGILFTANLLDKSGHTVLTASALIKVNDYKDWEIGETAARQRLVAAAGFDGQSILYDESHDLAAQSKPPQPTASTPVEAATESKKPPSTRRSSRGGSKKRANGDSHEKDVKTPQQARQPDGVPPAMVRQIEHLAKLKGIEVDTPTSIEEAKNMLKELLA